MTGGDTHHYKIKKTQKYNMIASQNVSTHFTISIFSIFACPGNSEQR
jgi:hypothetical protein